MATSIGTLTASLQLNVSGFTSGIQKAQYQLGAFQKTVTDNSASISSLGRTFSLVGASLAATVGLMARAAIQFEDAFAGVRKTVDATEQEFGVLSKSIRQMSKEIPVAATELARIGEVAGQLGVRGVGNLERFIKTTALIGVTTTLTTEEAATGFARLSNIMEEPISNIDRMGSAIVDLGNNFATTEPEILELSLRLAGAGKTAGLTTAEVLGLSTAMSSLGINAEAGGTAMSRIMVEVAKAVKQGGDELQNFASIAGMTSDEFSRLQESSPIDALDALIKGFRDIQKSGGDVFSTLEDVEFQNVRVRDALLRLINSQEGLTRATRMSNEAWGENNALQEEADKRFETTKSQLILLKNQITETAMNIGQEYQPAIESASESLRTFLDQMDDSRAMNAFIAWTAAAAAGILSFLGVVALLTVTIGTASTGLAAFGVAMKSLGLAAAAAAAPFAPHAALAIGLTALTALLSRQISILIQAIGLWERFPSVVSGAANLIGAQITPPTPLSSLDESEIILGTLETRGPPAPPTGRRSTIGPQSGKAERDALKKDLEDIQTMSTGLIETFEDIGRAASNGFAEAQAAADALPIPKVQTMSGGLLETFEDIGRAATRGFDDAKAAMDALPIPEVQTMSGELMDDWEDIGRAAENGFAQRAAPAIKTATEQLNEQHRKTQELAQEHFAAAILSENAWASFTTAFTAEVTTWGNQFERFAQMGGQTARNLHQVFSDSFFALMNDDIESLKNAWDAFFKAIGRMIADFLASVVVRELLEFVGLLKPTDGLSIGSGSGSGGVGDLSSLSSLSSLADLPSLISDIGSVVTTLWDGAMEAMGAFKLMTSEGLAMTESFQAAEVAIGTLQAAGPPAAQALTGAGTAATSLTTAATFTAAEVAEIGAATAAFEVGTTGGGAAGGAASGAASMAGPATIAAIYAVLAYQLYQAFSGKTETPFEQVFAEQAVVGVETVQMRGGEGVTSRDVVMQLDTLIDTMEREFEVFDQNGQLTVEAIDYMREQYGESADQMIGALLTMQDTMQTELPNAIKEVMEGDTDTLQEIATNTAENVGALKVMNELGISSLTQLRELDSGFDEALTILEAVPGIEQLNEDQLGTLASMLEELGVGTNLADQMLGELEEQLAQGGEQLRQGDAQIEAIRGVEDAVGELELEVLFEPTINVPGGGGGNGGSRSGGGGSSSDGAPSGGGGGGGGPVETGGGDDEWVAPGGDRGLQHGGIAIAPARRLIGEAGPEAVIPLDPMHLEAIGRAAVAAASGGDDDEEMRENNRLLKEILRALQHSGSSRGNRIG